MLILTLNTHSLIEDDYENKLLSFAHYVAELKPFVIGLQEVNQSIGAKKAEDSDMGYAVGSIPLREDNHALRAARLLNSIGEPYRFVWTGVKNGYGRFDEGLAIMTKEPMEDPSSFLISKTSEYTDWRTRRALSVKIGDTVFCTAHLGWWHDEREPFKEQFLKLDHKLKNLENVYLMGDFNCPDSAKNEGYSLVCSKGWQDLYTLAEKRAGYHTARGGIAGWEKSRKEDMRIDYIFSRKKVYTKNYATVFDGIRGDKISDHFGVAAYTEGGTT